MSSPNSGLPAWLQPSGPPSVAGDWAGGRCRQWWPDEAGVTHSTRAQHQKGNNSTTNTNRATPTPGEEDESLETLTALCTPTSDGTKAPTLLQEEQEADDDDVLERADTHGSTTTANLLPMLQQQSAANPTLQLQPLPHEPGGHNKATVGSDLVPTAAVAASAAAPTHKAVGATPAAAAVVEEDVGDDIPLVSARTNSILDIMCGRSATNTVVKHGSPVRAHPSHALPVLAPSVSAASNGSNAFSAASGSAAAGGGTGAGAVTITPSASPGGSSESWLGLAACTAADASVPSVAVLAAPSGAPTAAFPASSLGPAASLPEAAQVSRLLYVGVFLTPASREVLLSMVPPAHPLLRSDHMTLAYRPSILQALRYPLGAEVQLRVLGAASSDRVQAVFVEAPPWAETTAACAHVTVSVAAGAKAVEAGQLLQDALQQAALASAADLAYCPTGLGAYQHFDEPLPLLGRVGVRLAVPCAVAADMGWIGAAQVVQDAEAEVVVYGVDELARCGCFGIDSTALEGFYRQHGSRLGQQVPSSLALPTVSERCESPADDALSSACVTPDAKLLSSTATPANSNSPWMPPGSAQAAGTPLQGSPLKGVAAAVTDAANPGPSALDLAGSSSSSPPVGYGVFGVVAGAGGASSAAGTPPAAVTTPTGGLAAILAAAASGSGKTATSLAAVSPPNSGGLAAMLAACRNSAGSSKSQEQQPRTPSAGGGGGLAALLAAAAAAGGSSSDSSTPVAAQTAAHSAPLTPLSLSALGGGSSSKPTAADGTAAAAAGAGGSPPDTPKNGGSSASSGSSSSIEAVQFRSLVHEGDYVAVRPFIPTEGGARLLQGYVREFASDEPFQAEGVLAVLSDDTIGYVAIVLDSSVRGSEGGSSGGSRKGAGGSKKAAMGGAGSGDVGISTSGAAAAAAPAAAAAAAGPGVGSSSGDLDPFKQWILDAEAAVSVPVLLLEPALRHRTARDADCDLQLWAEFEALQQQHGEALCSTILASCNQDFEEAIELIKGQAGGLDRAAAAVAGGGSSGGGSGGGVGSPARGASSPPTTPAAAAAAAAGRSGSGATAAAAGAGAAVGVTAADEGFVAQLALSLGLLPEAALKLARLVPDLQAEAVVQALQSHRGDVGAAADALLSGQGHEGQDTPSPSNGNNSRGGSGQGSPTAGGSGGAKASAAGQDPARMVAAHRLREMSPGLSLDLALLLLNEHGGSLDEAAQALSDMQERELLARSAAAAAGPTTTTTSSGSGSSRAGASYPAAGPSAGLSGMEGLTEEDQMAILTAMGELEPEPQQQQQQQQGVQSAKQQQQQPAVSPVYGSPVFSVSPPQRRAQLPAPAAAAAVGPSFYSHSNSSNAQQQQPGRVPYPYPPPPPPPQQRALMQDFADLEAKRAAKAAADELYKKATSFSNAYQVTMTAAQAKIKAGDKCGYEELKAKALEAKAQAAAAINEAQSISWSANNSNIVDWPVDLHGLSVTKAIAKFEQQFRCLRGMDHPGGINMRVIVGKGLHSEDNIPKIKLGVEQYLREREAAEAEGSGRPWGISWGVDAANPGVINVHIPADAEGL